MRMANIRLNHEDRVAVEVQNRLVCLPSVMHDTTLTSTDDVILACGGENRPRLLNDIAHIAESLPEVDPNQVLYRPAVIKPSKIFCIGLNYKRHAEETGSPIPTVPVVFGKFNNALAAHLDMIRIPHESNQVDYEVELTIVIGRRCHRVSSSDALTYVFGYTVANDVSARDLQNRTSQWLLGKSCDRFAPLGPFLVTADEIADPGQLPIGLRLNGSLRQNSTTADMIFSCPALIEYLSSVWTLEPGDVILTGTPEGVILGHPEPERVWIGPGDRTEAYIGQLGTLTNTFVED